MSFATMYYFYLPIMVFLSVLVFVWIERPAQHWLRHNMSRVPMMLLDLLLITIGVWISFALWLGSGQVEFEHACLFAFRIAPVAFFSPLLAFGIYGVTGPRWGRLVAAILLGSGIFISLMYYAWAKDWVEGFSRAVMLLNTCLALALLSGSRFLLQMLKPRPLLTENQA